jgi:hypothetical protein
MQQIGLLLQNLLFPQHVTDTIVPIIRSSRVKQMVAAVVLGSLVYCYVSGLSRKLDT